jgi:hypothetical protein
MAMAVRDRCSNQPLAAASAQALVALKTAQLGLQADPAASSASLCDCSSGSRRNNSVVSFSTSTWPAAAGRWSGCRSAAAEGGGIMDQ